MPRLGLKLVECFRTDFLNPFEIENPSDVFAAVVDLLAMSTMRELPLPLSLNL